MAVLQTPTSAYPWRPDVSVFHPADVVPQALILVASNVAGSIEGDQPSVRVAYVEDDEAQFTAEADLIPEATPALSEVQIFTGKITQLIRLSNEQYRQQGTDIQLAKSAQRAVIKVADAAFLSQVAPTPPDVQPAAGLLNIAGLVDGGEVGTNLDELVNLQAAIQVNGGQPSHIIVDPLGWAELRKLKTNDVDSNESLTGAGVTDAVPMLLSLPVIVNKECPPYSGVLIDKAAVVSAVGQVYVSVSDQRYFEYDSALLRITWRIGQNVVRPDRCGKFTVAGPGS